MYKTDFVLAGNYLNEGLCEILYSPKPYKYWRYDSISSIPIRISKGPMVIFKMVSYLEPFWDGTDETEAYFKIYLFNIITF